MTHSIIPADQIAKLQKSLWVLQQHNLLHHGESSNTVSEATKALSILDSLPQVEVVAWMKPNEGDYAEAFNWTQNENTGYTVPLYGSKT